jgi:hypothetical protein
VLAAPGGISLVDLKIRASASPAVSFLLDEIDTGRVVERIDAKAFLGPGNYKRAVLGALLADIQLCLGHTSSFSVVKVLARLGN